MPGFQIPLDKDKAVCAGQNPVDQVNRKLEVPYPAELTPSNIIETARSYRWLFEILPALDTTSFGATLATQAPGNLLTYLKRCDRPTMDFDEMMIHNGPRVMYRPGKFKFNQIKLEFYEILGPLASVDGPAIRIYEWMRKVVYKTQESIYSRYKDYTFNAKLALLKGNGQYLHIYELFGCYPVSIAPSELNYETDGISNIVVTLRYNDVVETRSPALEAKV